MLTIAYSGPYPGFPPAPLKLQHYSRYKSVYY